MMFEVGNGGDTYWLRIIANGRSLRYRLDESLDGKTASASIDNCPCPPNKGNEAKNRGCEVQAS
jgi:hypothetical protein